MEASTTNGPHEKRHFLSSSLLFFVLVVQSVRVVLYSLPVDREQERVLTRLLNKVLWVSVALLHPSFPTQEQEGDQLRS